jgi:hypothetical protein
MTETVQPDTTAAPAAPTPVSDREGLAGLFALQLDAEEKSPAKTNTRAPEAPAEVEPGASADEISDEASAATTEQEAAPDDGTSDQPAIDAPSGMSEQDRALWAQLSPEMKSWVSTREQSTRADYTRKTQAVAEQRKAADAMTQHLNGQLQQYDAILSQITNRNIAPPDPAMRMSDPLAYDEQLSTYIAESHQQQQAMDEQQRIRAEAQQLAQHQQRTWFTEQAQELAVLAQGSGVPDLAAGTESGKKLRTSVFQYATTTGGYSKEQLGQASARDMLTLWKAFQYDAQKTARSGAKTLPQIAPKATAPGPAKAPGRAGSLTAAVSNLKATGSRESLAAAFLADLNSER